MKKYPKGKEALKIDLEEVRKITNLIREKWSVIIAINVVIMQVNNGER